MRSTHRAAALLTAAALALPATTATAEGKFCKHTIPEPNRIWFQVKLSSTDRKPGGACQ